MCGKDRFRTRAPGQLSAIEVTHVSAPREYGDCSVVVLMKEAWGRMLSSSWESPKRHTVRVAQEPCGSIMPSLPSAHEVSTTSARYLLQGPEVRGQNDPHPIVHGAGKRSGFSTVHLGTQGQAPIEQSGRLHLFQRHSTRAMLDILCCMHLSQAQFGSNEPAYQVPKPVGKIFRHGRGGGSCRSYHCFAPFPLGLFRKIPTRHLMPSQEVPPTSPRCLLHSSRCWWQRSCRRCLATVSSNKKCG